MPGTTPRAPITVRWPENVFASFDDDHQPQGRTCRLGVDIATVALVGVPDNETINVFTRWGNTRRGTVGRTEQRTMVMLGRFNALARPKTIFRLGLSDVDRGSLEIDSRIFVEADLQIT